MAKIKTHFECPACLARNDLEILKPNSLSRSIISRTCIECKSTMRIRFARGKTLGTVAYDFLEFIPSEAARIKMDNFLTTSAKTEQQKEV